MKKLIALLTITTGLLFLADCQSARLESGGAYAPVGQVPDMQFYQVDAAYDLAYAAIDGAFTFERDNRLVLWGVSPQIKHTLDSIRPQAVQANIEYHRARAAYMANPVPANLGLLQQILAKVEQLMATAHAALATNGVLPNK